MNYKNTPEFEKEFKKFLKKFPTLEEDLNVAKKNSIELFHNLKIDNRGIEQVPKIGSEKVKIFKIKKFSCKSLKGKGCQSGIRIIYAFIADKQEIQFIEIYYKGDKENMDFERAKSCLDS